VAHLTQKERPKAPSGERDWDQPVPCQPSPTIDSEVLATRGGLWQIKASALGKAEAISRYLANAHDAGAIRVLYDRIGD
jgi:hypothetical protein